MIQEWNGFKKGVWENEINVRDFIQKNYTPYDGDDSFLAGPTKATSELWEQVLDLSKKEREAGGVLDMDTKTISTITRQTSLLSVLYSLMVVSEWQRKPVKTMDTRLTQK